MLSAGIAPAWAQWAGALLAARRAEQPADHRPLIERCWAALVAEDSALMRIASAWQLSPAEIAVLAICGAVQLDPRLGTLCAAANGNPAAAFATIDLLRELIGTDALPATGSSLLRAGCLIEIDDRGPLAGAEVRLARSVAWMLADVPIRDDDLPVNATLRATDADQEAPRAGRLLIASADRIRRLQAVERHLDAPAFIHCTPPSTTAGWHALIRQATAGVLGIALDYASLQAPEEIAGYWISRAAHLPWAICSTQPLPLGSLPDESWLEFPAEPEEVTDAEWAAVFPGAPPPRRRPVARHLHSAAQAQQPDETPEQTLRRVAGRALLRHARRIAPTADWDSLVLPLAQLRQLRELVDRYRYRATVHDRWRLPVFPSPGVVALFAGPSGTGKTTAAQVIAADLHLDVFRVDLSALVSKYIGETEKNLEEVFTAAQDGEFLLLFDEADALFGRRSAVSDAHDRYANVETAYLLQRIETFDGFVIMTSNFQGNIDEAFLRRIHVSVPFSVPEAADRHRIWDRCLAGAPRGDIDLAFVAEQFDLAGGSIRLAALSAATMAAAHDGPVEMTDILRAVDHEMTKLRRRTNDHQFGRWRESLVD